MSIAKHRDLRLDLIRVVAIVAVVWIHCQENGNFSLALGPIPVDAATYLFGRMGVPLFFMLTGALLIPREISPKRFYLTRVLPLYLLSVFWIFVYSAVALRAAGAGVSAGVIAHALGRALCLLPSEKHLWYLGFIVAVYLLMPLLARLKRVPTGPVIALALALYVFTGIRLAAGLHRTAWDLAAYIAFVLTGYLWTDRILPRIRRRKALCSLLLPALTAVSAAAFLGTYLNDRFRNAFAARGLDIWWYYSPFIILTAAFLFCSLHAAGRTDGHAVSGPTSRVLAFLSANSFGVYLIHLLVIRFCFGGAFFVSPEHASIGTAALACAGTLAVGFTISAIWGQIPGLRLLLFRRGGRPGSGVGARAAAGRDEACVAGSDSEKPSSDI